MDRLETANLCLTSDQGTYSNGTWTFDLTKAGLEDRVVAWEVVSASIPQTYFLVGTSTSYISNTQVVITDPGTGFVYSDYFGLRVSPQYWTGTTLAAAMQSFLNTYITWVGQTWTVTFNNATSAFTISGTNPFVINNAPIFNFPLMTFMGFPNTTSPAASVTGQAVQLSGPPYIYFLSTKLASMACGTFSVLNGQQTGVIAAMPLISNTQGDTSVTYFRYNWQPYRTCVNGILTQLDIRIVFPNFLNIDFRGAAWGLNLILYLKPGR